MIVLRFRQNHPRWCGPTAVALLTGCTVNVAAQMYANVKNFGSITKPWRIKRRSETVIGVTDGETRSVLGLLGYKMSPVNVPKGSTLANFVNRSDSLRPTEKLLIQIPGHYVVAYGSRIYDNNQLDRQPEEHLYGQEPAERAWVVDLDPQYSGFSAAA